MYLMSCCNSADRLLCVVFLCVLSYCCFYVVLCSCNVYLLSCCGPPRKRDGTSQGVIPNKENFPPCSPAGDTQTDTRRHTHRHTQTDTHAHGRMETRTHGHRYTERDTQTHTHTHTHTH